MEELGNVTYYNKNRKAHNVIFEFYKALERNTMKYYQENRLHLIVDNHIRIVLFKYMI